MGLFKKGSKYRVDLPDECYAPTKGDVISGDDKAPLKNAALTSTVPASVKILIGLLLLVVVGAIVGLLVYFVVYYEKDETGKVSHKTCAGEIYSFYSFLCYRACAEMFALPAENM